VPCHRVIHANGALAGFAGGIDRKVWLLGHERSSAISARSAAGGGRHDRVGSASRTRPVEITSGAGAPSSRRATSRRRTDPADRAAR
jgi:hypothetical protein